jgi:hypothetical protein
MPPDLTGDAARRNGKENGEENENPNQPVEATFLPKRQERASPVTLDKKMKHTTPICLIFLLAITGCGRQHPQPRGIYDRTSIKIEANQMGKFTHPVGVALVDFTAFRSDGASYRWRFMNASNHIESAGTGTVAETSRKLLGVKLLNKSDTSLYVIAGDLWIPWSYDSMDATWLYYTKGETEIQVLSDSKFETEELSNQPVESALTGAVKTSAHR